MISPLKTGFAWFGLISAFVASISILANDGYLLSNGALTINAIFLVIGVLLAAVDGPIEILESRVSADLS